MDSFKTDLLFALGRENCMKMSLLFPPHTIVSNQEKGNEVPMVVTTNDKTMHPEQNAGNSKVIAIKLAKGVSRKQLEIWTEGLVKLGTRVCCSFEKISSNEVDIFIIPEKMDANKFVAWTNQSEIPKPESGVFITTTQFAIDILQQNRLMIPAEYLHELQHEPAAESSSSTTSSNKKDSDFRNLEQEPRHPIALPSSTLNHNKSSSSSSSSSSSAIVTYAPNDIIIPVNLNEHITPFLVRLAEYYATQKATQEMNFRRLSFVRCVSVLTSYHKKVESLADLMVNGHYLKFFGESMRAIIQEILADGRCSRLEDLLNSDPTFHVIANVTRVWGIGEKTAVDLYKKHGVKTVEDLRNLAPGILTTNQAIGLRLFDDLQTRIPREEVTAISEFVQTTALSLCREMMGKPDMSGLQVEVCGSYRRGAKDCGDVDILMAPPDDYENLPDGFLHALVDRLDQVGFLTDHLAMPHNAENTHNRLLRQHHSSNSTTSTTTQPRSKTAAGGTDKPAKRDAVRCSYMGVCKLSKEGSIHRRIDMKTYPRSAYPFAISYFTGPDMFNRSFRLHASFLGYNLNDKGLFKTIRKGPCAGFNQSRDKVATKNDSEPCRNEQELFAKLGIPYMTPETRCAFVSPESPKARVLRRIQQQLVQQAQQAFDQEHQNDKHKNKRARVEGGGAAMAIGHKSVEALFKELSDLEEMERKKMRELEHGGSGDGTIGEEPAVMEEEEKMDEEGAEGEEGENIEE